MTAFLLTVATMVILPLFALVLAFVLASQQYFFTFVREGTVMYVMRGDARNGTFDHCLMAWKGHYLNDPRRLNFDPSKPEWEVIPCENGQETPSAYGLFSPWRLFEYFGIYWYGFSPFYTLHVYTFRWSEPRMNNETKQYEAFPREENTQINFVNSFVYWVHLDAAENKENIPLSLGYLLTIEINNPYQARFGLTDWLARLTADTNNAAKVWVGNNDLDVIVQEKGQTESPFVEALRTVNSNLGTDHNTIGAPVAIGVTVKASSLQEVDVAGRNQEEIIKATNAKVIAEKEKDATIVKAEGDKKATILRAEGERQAKILNAEGDEKAIDLVYRKVKEFGSDGILLAQLDAMSKANAAGGTIIWANNPFFGNSGIADILQRANVSPEELMALINSRSKTPGTKRQPKGGTR